MQEWWFLGRYHGQYWNADGGGTNKTLGESSVSNWLAGQVLQEADITRANGQRL